MATLTTVVVFLPITFMLGLGKYLFTPLAVSATFAMAASYFVSRTVSPLFCSKFLRPHTEAENYPWWLMALGLVLALIGLGVPALARMIPWLDGLPDAVRDVLSWPFLHLHGSALLVLTGLGAVGAILFLVGVLFRVSPLFQRVFEKASGAYEWVLRVGLRVRYGVVAAVLLLLVPAYWCFAHTGQELFPEVDASEFTIHLRASGGPRVEATEDQVTRIEKMVRDIIPEEDVEMILSNIGINSRWSAIYTSNNGPHAAFIRVQLRSGFAGRHTAALEYVERIRRKLSQEFPGDDFFFETGGMIRRILNSGSIAPIEVMVFSRDPVLRRALARNLDTRIGRIPHVKETYMPQGMDLPQYRVEVNRTMAQLLGLSEADAVRNVIATLMSSSQLAPNFWMDPRTGNPYLIGVQYPPHFMKDKHTLERIPVTPDGTRGGEARARTRLDQVATLQRTQAAAEIYHFDIARVSQIFISVGDQDLAGTAAEIERIVAEYPLKYALTLLPADKRHLAGDERFKDKVESYFLAKKPEQANKLRKAMLAEYQVDPQPLKLPPGVRFEVRGEVSSMRDSFGQMTFNLGLAVLLLYLLMAAQFASWRDPLIMIVAAPLGLIGVAVTLWVTGTSLNVQSFMGVLMMIGISQSNSTLLVDYANRLRGEGMDTLAAIVKAARARLQPILMTSIATVVGLLPMAIHTHPGDEMNLPLARAVIGGLLSSTLLTLFVVPVLYVLLKPRGPAEKVVADAS
jgi:multidrug efflux pump subunit AcrB